MIGFVAFGLRQICFARWSRLGGVHTPASSRADSSNASGGFVLSWNVMEVPPVLIFRGSSM